jgi:hypothetical protein
MNWQTILELQCEGGTIRLVGSNTGINWLFRFETEEWALADEGGGCNQSVVVEGLNAARQMLDDRYPHWKHFYISYLAPECAKYFNDIIDEDAMQQADAGIKTLETTIEQFIRNFVRNPYECYTEHGQHALFFTKLYEALPEDKRYLNIEVAPDKTIRVCAIQKEYPTKVDLGKERRQNWDIAVIKEHNAETSYDYLNLSAIVEFGMNASLDHLVDDFLRVSHPDANADNRYIVHLYRLSEASGKSRISGRDWSANARDIKQIDEIKQLLQQMSAGGNSILMDRRIADVLDTRPHEKQESCKQITAYFAIADSAGVHEQEIFKFQDGKMSSLA